MNAHSPDSSFVLDSTNGKGKSGQTAFLTQCSAHSVNCIKVTTEHFDVMSKLPVFRPVFQRNPILNQIQGTRSLLLICRLESLPKISRKGSHAPRGAIRELKPKGIFHPLQRDALTFRPLSQVSSQKLLSVHLHDPQLGKAKMYATRHSTTGSDLTILPYWRQARSKSHPSPTARRLGRHDC